MASSRRQNGWPPPWKGKAERWGQIHQNVRPFLESLFSMPVREAIISAAAVLDVCLGELLQRRLLQDEKRLADFLGLNDDRQRPARNFGVRIKLAYLLGLIGKDTVRVLDAIRSIRNRLAHRVQVSDEMIDSELRVLVDFFVALDTEEAYLTPSERKGLQTRPASDEPRTACLVLLTAAMLVEEFERRLPLVTPIKRVIFQCPRDDDAKLLASV